MCIGAVDFLGDAMNCKGSVFSTIVCNESSWCDGRDEEIVQSKSANQRVNEDDASGRYGDLIDTQSLSSSVHHLLHDSSQRQRRSPLANTGASSDAIFRKTQDTTSQSAEFSGLNRCTAWVQDDYSFESERLSDNSRTTSNVRIVHWEDRVSDSESLNSKNGCRIFRPIESASQSDSKCVRGFKLERCAAWSIDESSLIASSTRRDTPKIINDAKVVHWDELVQGVIR